MLLLFWFSQKRTGSDTPHPFPGTRMESEHLFVFANDEQGHCSGPLTCTLTFLKGFRTANCADGFIQFY